MKSGIARLSNRRQRQQQGVQASKVDMKFNTAAEPQPPQQCVVHLRANGSVVISEVPIAQGAEKFRPAGSLVQAFVVVRFSHNNL